MKVPFVYDADDTLSLGRSFLVMLLLLSIIKFWFIGIDIPSTLETIVLALFGYELGKKARDVVKTKITPKDEDIES